MTTANSPARDRNWRRFLPLAIILGGLAAGYALGWQRYLSLSYLAESQEALQQTVAANRPVAMAAFGVLYTLAVAFSFPAASVLTIFGGFLFGWLAGGLIVAIAATTGATLIFLAARSAFGGALIRRAGGAAAKLAEGFEENSFLYLLVLRLAPVFPFFVVNVAPALFNIGVRTYVAATLIGILPGTFTYAYLGQSIGGVLDAAKLSGQTPSIRDLVTPQLQIAFLLLALLALVPDHCAQDQETPKSHDDHAYPRYLRHRSRFRRAVCRRCRRRLWRFGRAD
jgi:uncharacterized membrane protein YdjX (TVP38/TMEM64 family)